MPASSITSFPRGKMKKREEEIITSDLYSEKRGGGGEYKRKEGAVGEYLLCEYGRKRICQKACFCLLLERMGGGAGIFFLTSEKGRKGRMTLLLPQREKSGRWPSSLLYCGDKRSLRRLLPDFQEASLLSLKRGRKQNAASFLDLREGPDRKGGSSTSAIPEEEKDD